MMLTPPADSSPQRAKRLTKCGPANAPRGQWREFGCGGFPPAESDEYYTTILAALAVGIAPEDYAKTPAIQDGLKRMRGYFAKLRLRHLDLHHKAMMLWASLYVDDLMLPRERNATIAALLSQQRRDGGWSFSAMRPEQAVRHNGKPISESPSDGYGTAFAIYILREAGLPSSRSELVRGVAWLKKNQRRSGRWFTPSPHAGDVPESDFGTRDLYIQYVGTAFAVLALKSCEE